MDELNNSAAKTPEGVMSTPSATEIAEEQSVEQGFLQHYGLIEQPFGVTPDPRFLYYGPQHRQALAALNYGTESNRGFLTLIARPGMGKTSLIFQYLDALRDTARTVFLFHTEGDSRDLMSYILADLGLDSTGKDLPAMHALLNRVLLKEMRANRRLILVIDEAQNLKEKVLESVRLLSNFETPWKKLMQIVLAGQPQLTTRLEKPSMVQLRQRISLSIRIEPLSGDQIGSYVNHRLWVAGHRGSPIFSVGAQKLLADSSDGIPRNINNLCFCAMSLGWATGQKSIDREMIREVLADLNPEKPQPQSAAMPNLANHPGQGALILKPPPVLTVVGPRTFGRAAKAAVAGFALRALGWSGAQFNIGPRVTDSLHDASTSAKPPQDATPPELSEAPASAPIVRSLQAQKADTSSGGKREEEASPAHAVSLPPSQNSGGASH